MIRRRGDDDDDDERGGQHHRLSPATTDSKYGKGSSPFGLGGILTMMLVGGAILVVLYIVLHPIPSSFSFQQDQQQILVNLCEHVEYWDTTVRNIKSTVDIFETDPGAQAAARQLQAATRALLSHVYGAREPYRVVVDLTFPAGVTPDIIAEQGAAGQFVIEMAPAALVPHSVYTFLEMARQFQGGAFHRIAGHVLQVKMSKIDPQKESNDRNNYPHTISHLAFQEYDPAFPHRKKTVGYAGRPSGPAWYASIRDNTRNHGPGSQQKRNPHEADALFGTIVEGFDDTVLRITKIPGTGFLPNPAHHVKINSMTILVPTTEEDEKNSVITGTVYKEWKPPTSMCMGPAPKDLPTLPNAAIAS